MRRGPVILLLLAFVAGGVLAPAVHRAQHLAEAGAVLSSHDEAGHHHHDALDDHGLEWTPVCDRPVLLDDLTCVLCKVVQGGDVAAEASCDAPARARDAVLVPSPIAGVARAGASRVRGPPHLIA